VSAVGVAVDLATGAALTWLGLTVGRTTGRRAARRGVAEPAPDLTCGCGHPLAVHEPSDTGAGGGPCRDRVPRQLRDTFNNRAGTRWETCPCRRYVGPLPPEDYLTLLQAPSRETVSPVEKRRPPNMVDEPPVPMGWE
jgi:hypothetical protein